MHIALTPEQEALRAELREYFAALVTPERRAAWQRPRATSSATATAGASSATPASTRT